MALHLVVAPTSAPLADVLADELSRVPADPFTREVVAVPADGVRTWLVTQLSERLGATSAPGSSPDRSAAEHPSPDGVVANVEFVFPATLVRRALGHLPGVAPRSPWEVGPLTWSIYELAVDRGAELAVDADAVRCRAIADLLDRYALHRPEMLRAWEAGHDADALGRPLSPHLTWQPRLWRALCERLGHPSGPTRLTMETNELRLGRITPALPDRVFLVGLVSLPPPHLAVLSALSSRIDVHVFAPTWSAAVWDRVAHSASQHPDRTPIERSADPSGGAIHHPLAQTWGRAAREAQLLLARTVNDASGSIATVEAAAPAEPTPTNLLLRLQADLRADRAPVGATADTDDRPVVEYADDSVRWHRCHGAARQAEVIRDVVVGLLEETEPDGSPRFEPRDIALLCADPVTMAPLVEAAFVGDPAHGVPSVPLRVADRSLRDDTPLLGAVASLLGLLDRRFRASEILTFAALDPVRLRFGFDADGLGVLAEWADRTNVRWGIEPDGRAIFGLPAELHVHTWRAGLEQLAVGSVMADPELLPAGMQVDLGPGDTVPADHVEGDQVVLLGRLAELVERLSAAVERLARPQTVHSWCAALAESVASLCALDDADAWQWRQLDQVISDLAAEAVIGDVPISTEVSATELAALMNARLTGRPGRVRFGTGAVTLSSLTAQRSIPHRVICLVGLDGDLASGAARSDDLVALTPCVGDRDPRSELRAQLLDAVLAAGDRLVITSTGHDLRTNAPVPPSVPLAELADLIDATARTADPTLTASEAIAVDHPRHGWSDRNFVAGELGVDRPWSFDRGALDAARARRTTGARSRFLTTALPAEPPGELRVATIERALRNPVQNLLGDRLGMRLIERSAVPDDVIPLGLSGLDAYQLRDGLLVERLRAGDRWNTELAEQWTRRQHLAGHVPPGDLGTATIASAVDVVDGLVANFHAVCGPASAIDPTEIDIELDLDGRPLKGVIGGVRDDVLVDVRAATIHAHHVLGVWFRLVLLALAYPERTWRAAVVGLDSKKPTAQVFRVIDRGAALEALKVAVDLHDRSRREVVPALPATTRLIHERGVSAGRDGWTRYVGRGDGSDPWVRFALGQLDYADLLAEPPLDDESGPGWGTSPHRIERWAQRIWGTFEQAIALEADDGS